eukprot:jgi/Psemu1/22992/gm1.22992_g
MPNSPNDPIAHRTRGSISFRDQNVNNPRGQILFTETLNMTPPASPEESGSEPDEDKGQTNIPSFDESMVKILLAIFRIKNEENDKLCMSLIQGRLHEWPVFLDALLEFGFTVELTYPDRNSGLQAIVPRTIQRAIEALAEFVKDLQEKELEWQNTDTYTYDAFKLFRNQRAKRLQQDAVLNPSPPAPGMAISRPETPEQLQYEWWSRKSHNETSFTPLKNDSRFEHWLIRSKAKLEAHDIDTATFLDENWPPSALRGFARDLFVKQCAFFWVPVLQAFKSDLSSSCVLSHSNKQDGWQTYFDFINLHSRSKSKVYDTLTRLQTLLSLLLTQWKESKVKFIMHWFDELEHLNKLRPPTRPLEYQTVKLALCQACATSFQLSEQFSNVTVRLDSNNISVYIQAEADAIHDLKITLLLEATRLDSQALLSVPKSTVRAHAHNLSIKDSIPPRHQRHHSNNHRGVSPDITIDTKAPTMSRGTGKQEIRYLREQLEDLAEDNRDLLEFAGDQNNQLQTQNRLLLEYVEDSNSDDSDDEMTRKKDYAVLKDHMDDTQMKLIMIPTSIDVYKFKKTLTNALAEVASTKCIQGGGYAFLLETEAQSRTRERNPDAVYLAAPIEPLELDSSVELTSDTYKLWKRNQALYLEWNKYNWEALLLTDKKFPNTLDKLNDPGSKAFPRGTTALEAFQNMEADLCSSDTQRRLAAELTKKMSGLLYSPNPLGPREYFRILTKYQHQINLLPTTGNVSSAQMIDYLHLAFERRKHDPVTLYQVEEDWKVHRMTVGNDSDNSYHAKTDSTNMVDVKTDRCFANLEDTQKELVSVYHKQRSQADTATAASTITMSNQWDSALSALRSEVNQLKANQQQPQAGSQPQTQPWPQRPPRTGGRLQTKWKQYKHYCHSCGVNPSHDGGDCIRFKPNHQVGATYANKTGWSVWNVEKWMKWSEPNSHGMHNTPP